MRTTLRIQASLRNPQPLHRPAANQMLPHNLVRILRPHPPVPNRLRIHHHRRPVFALLQASCLVDAHPSPKSGLFGQLTQPRMKLAAPIASARGPRRIGRPRVVADKYMPFECRQTSLPPRTSSSRLNPRPAAPDSTRRNRTPVPALSTFAPTAPPESARMDA